MIDGDSVESRGRYFARAGYGHPDDVVLDTTTNLPRGNLRDYLNITNYLYLRGLDHTHGIQCATGERSRRF